MAHQLYLLHCYGSVEETEMIVAALLKEVDVTEHPVQSRAAHAACGAAGCNAEASWDRDLTLPCLIRPEPQLSHVTTFEAVTR